MLWVEHDSCGVEHAISECDPACLNTLGAVVWRAASPALDRLRAFRHESHLPY
jgi:hypothetical protein